MTFADFAKKWTDTEQSNWLNNIISSLRGNGYNIFSDSTLGDFFSGEE